MPIFGEHSGKVKNHSDFKSITIKSKDITEGIRVLFGNRKDNNKSETITYRFDSDIFTPEEARKWLEDNNVNIILFEKAIEIDSFRLSFDSSQIEKFERTEEGFLRVPVKITKTGVFDYPEHGMKKAKLPEDLFSFDTVNSLRGLPIVDEHPIENGKYTLITPENYTKFAKGTVSEPKVKDSFIAGIATIWDSALIESVVSKEKTEVSLGFTNNTISKSGILNGKQYDAVQKDIIGNHLAVTKAGKAGPSVRLEIDSKNINLNRSKTMGIKYLIEIDGKIKANPTMLTLKTSDGKDIQVDSEIHTEIQSVRNDLKAKTKEIDSLTTAINDLKTKNVDGDSTAIKSKQIEIDALNAQVNKLKSDVKKIEDSFDSKVDEAAKTRVEVLKNSELLEIDSKGKTIEQLQRDIISKTLDIDGHTLKDEEVGPYYSSALAYAKKEATTKKKKTPDNDSNVDAYKKRNEDLEKLYSGELK